MDVGCRLPRVTSERLNGTSIIRKKKTSKRAKKDYYKKVTSDLLLKTLNRIGISHVMDDVLG